MLTTLGRASVKAGQRAFSSTRQQANSFTKYRGRPGWAFAATSATLATGATVYYAFSSPVIQNDAQAAPPRQLQNESSQVTGATQTSPGMSPLVWGSNANHLIAPEQSTNECFRLPTYMSELFTDPLKDVKFSREHAACVDASGDVYQWGDGFFGTDAEASDRRKPMLTLHGKNIVSVSVTPRKVFALSASGAIYALSSSLQEQKVSESTKSWFSFFSGEPQPYHTVLDTDVPLHSGEKFTSISAGSDHLLALTSNGRTFAHPVTRHANLRGQLGIRKITIQDPTHAKARLPIELFPVSPGENLRRISHDYHESEVELEEPVNDKQVGYCDRLFEVPVLRDIKVKKVVAGEKSSYALTEQEGHALAWGANEFGQLGLGANITTSNVLVPTEVILTKFTKRSVSSKCVDIFSAGDLTFFTVERQMPFTKAKVVDVLACGNGQWGGLGNASYSTAQGEPTKVKEISGLLEYDEETQTLQPLKPYLITVAPSPSQGLSNSGHVIAMLDTIPHSHPKAESQGLEEIALPPGRDVLAWGLNQHFQLGNGRRSSSSVPVSCQTSDGEGRLMCKVNKQTVRDFKGKVVKWKANVEQRVVAGPGFSMIYWKISG